MVTSIQHSFRSEAIVFGVDAKVNKQVHLASKLQKIKECSQQNIKTT